jgi:hypothetical protein
MRNLWDNLTARAIGTGFSCGMAVSFIVAFWG